MRDYLLTIIGVGLLFLGSLRYAVDTAKRRVRANRVTWAIWTVVSLTCFIAQLHSGVGLVSALTLATGIGPFLVLLATIRNPHAYTQITRLDACCGFLAIISLALWALTSNPNFNIVILITVDWFGALPLLVKTYRAAQPEGASTYLFWALAGAVTLTTVHDWRFAAYGVPLNAVIMSTALLSAAVTSRQRLLT